MTPTRRLAREQVVLVCRGAVSRNFLKRIALGVGGVIVRELLQQCAHGSLMLFIVFLAHGLPLMGNVLRAGAAETSSSSL